MSNKYVTMDGNEAAAYMAYPFTEVAAIYPITPSSPMAGLTDAWSAKGRENVFNCLRDYNVPHSLHIVKAKASARFGLTYVY